jgi:hypothetical protein
MNFCQNYFEKMSFTAEEIAKQNILEENFKVSIGQHGPYCKGLSVVTLKEPVHGCKIAVEVYLLFDSQPTKCAVLLTLEEFEKFSDLVKNITKETPYVEKSEYSDKCEWQLYTHNQYKGIWILELRDDNGLESKIGLTLNELRSVAISKNFLMKHCNELNIKNK